MSERGLLLPTVSAIATPPLAYLALNPVLLVQLAADPGARNAGSILMILMFALVIGLGHVILLGLPFCVALRRLGLCRWWSMSAGGLVLGALPLAIFSWPRFLKGSGASDSGGIMLVDGVPTALWWSGYWSGVAQFAAIGAISALVFWLVWSRREKRA